MEQFLNELLIAVVTVAIPIVVKYLTSYLNALKKKHLAEVEQDDKIAFDNSIIEAIDLVQKVVDKVSQTYVDSLKAQGKFDKEAQVESFNKAFEDAKSLISTETQGLISSVYTDFDKWVEVQIESYIRNKKLEVSAAQ